MERMDRLWPMGPAYYYDDSLFQPSTDTFLLGAFAQAKRGETVCDLGAGTGLLGLLLWAREPSILLHNVECQAPALQLAERTALENGLNAHHHLGDLRQLDGVLQAGCCDLVVSNPPYFSTGSGRAASSAARQTARSEISCTLEELCAAAGRLLRWGGRFALVYRPERLCDLMCALRAYGMEPKRLRMVQNTAAAAPSLVLLEARRGGKPNLTIDPPLILRAADGSESAEVQTIYFR